MKTKLNLFTTMIALVLLMFVAACGDDGGENSTNMETNTATGEFIVKVTNLHSAPVTIRYQDADSASSKVSEFGNVLTGAARELRSSRGQGLTIEIIQEDDLGFDLDFSTTPTDQVFVVTDNQGMLGDNQDPFFENFKVKIEAAGIINITIAPFQEVTE